MAKEINTVLQNAFLNVLFDEDVKGDIRKAMKKAGYSENTSANDVIAPLQDQIIDRSRKFMALHAGKAAYGLVDLMDNPNVLGGKNKIAAAESLLDRIGIVKKDETLANLPKGAIILLPPKREVQMVEAEFTVIEENDD